MLLSFGFFIFLLTFLDRSQAQAKVSLKKIDKKISSIEGRLAATDDVPCLKGRDCRLDDNVVETIPNVSSIWECENLVPGFMNFGFTYDLFARDCYILNPLPSSRKCSISRRFISGEKYCLLNDIHKAVENGICFPPLSRCGSCPCCVCIPIINRCAGPCLSSSVRSVAEGELSAISEASDYDCYDVCHADPLSEACISCIQRSVPGSDNFPGLKCLGCVSRVVKAFFECRNEIGLGNLSRLFNCIKDKLQLNGIVPCLDCICSIVSKISPSLGEACHDTIGTGEVNGRSLDRTTGCIAGYEVYTDQISQTQWCIAAKIQQQNRDTATATCQNDNAKLVSIDSTDKNNFLAKMILSVTPCSISSTLGCFWIGVQYSPPGGSTYENRFGWVDTNSISHEQQKFVNFDQSGTPQQVKSADFAAMNFQAPTSWINLKTETLAYFFCEYPLTSTSTSTSTSTHAPSG